MEWNRQILIQAALNGPAKSSASRTNGGSLGVSALWGIIKTTYSGPAPEEPVLATVKLTDGSKVSCTVTYQAFMDNADIAHLIIIREPEEE